MFGDEWMRVVAIVVVVVAVVTLYLGYVNMRAAKCPHKNKLTERYESSARIGFKWQLWHYGILAAQFVCVSSGSFCVCVYVQCVNWKIDNDFVLITWLKTKQTANIFSNLTSHGYSKWLHVSGQRDPTPSTSRYIRLIARYRINVKLCANEWAAHDLCWNNDGLRYYVVYYNR